MKIKSRLHMKIYITEHRHPPSLIYIFSGITPTNSVKLRNMTWLLPTLGGHSLVLSPTHTGTRSVIIGNLGLEPYFSMVFLLQETLGWCNGKTRQRYFKFEYLIISSLLSALEDTSWALRSVIQIWMKTFSFNSII